MAKLQANFLSVSILLANGLKVQFIVDKWIVGDANGDVVANNSTWREFVPNDLHGGIRS